MSAESSINASYQRLKQLMTCFVCYNKYNASRKPKWLICKHYFCQQCLDEIQEKGIIKCPLCRQLQFYSEETSVHPDAVVDLMERASTQLARLKANERLKRELETAKIRKIQMCDERERKLEADLADFRQSPTFNDFSTLQLALALMKSQVIPLASHRDRIDFYSDFQDKLEQCLRNSTNATNADVISWIEGVNDKITAEDFTDYHFIRALAAAIINCSISKHRGGLHTIRTCVLKHWAPVLKRYVDSEIVYYTKHNASMEIRLILAVQELTSQRKYPKGLTLDIFNAFGENGVFLSCFDVIRKTSCSSQSVDSLAFYIVACLPQVDKSIKPL